MANTTANDALVPFSLQPGRINDFVNGMRESSDQRAKAALEAAGVFIGLRTWSSFHRYMKDH
jgi:hypothetical protein